tara:strand:+ start:180 stop:806 length:627 start_codon:yes stop_codon:yes gene_type:complete
MLKLTPKDLKRDSNSEMVKELLSSKYLTFSVDQLVVRENKSSDNTVVECDLEVRDQNNDGTDYKIAGEGLGVLDALFNGITDKVAVDCNTLNNISVQGFEVSVDKEDLKASREKSRGTSATVKICLTINNGFDSNNRLIPFRSRSRSMLSASVDVVVKTIQYFVNSEVAVLYLKELIGDAKKRGRPDLTEHYVSKLSDLMSNTSYENI